MNSILHPSLEAIMRIKPKSPRALLSITQELTAYFTIEILSTKIANTHIYKHIGCLMYTSLNSTFCFSLMLFLFYFL